MSAEPRHELRILPAHGTLGDVWRAGGLAAGDLVALDFDQTVTQVAGGVKRVRGGSDARAALADMTAAGVTTIIITAQSPTETTLESLAGELRELGLAELFAEPGSAPLASAPARVLRLDGGIPIACKGRCLAARYNKPEALQFWLQRELLLSGRSPARCLFVDDSSDNAVSMFLAVGGSAPGAAAAAEAPSADSFPYLRVERFDAAANTWEVPTSRHRLRPHHTRLLLRLRSVLTPPLPPPAAQAETSLCPSGSPPSPGRVPLPRTTAVWYPPPPSSAAAEQHDPATRAFLHQVKRPDLPTLAPRPAPPLPSDTAQQRQRAAPAAPPPKPPPPPKAIGADARRALAQALAARPAASAAATALEPPLLAPPALAPPPTAPPPIIAPPPAPPPPRTAPR